MIKLFSYLSCGEWRELYKANDGHFYFKAFGLSYVQVSNIQAYSIAWHHINRNCPGDPTEHEINTLLKLGQSK